MTAKFMASMEVTERVLIAPSQYRVVAKAPNSTLTFTTPWPPDVGDFIIVKAQPAGHQ